MNGTFMLRISKELSSELLIGEPDTFSSLERPLVGNVSCDDTTFKMNVIFGAQFQDNTYQALLG